MYNYYVQNLSEVDLKEMLVCAAWQRVREEWKRQMKIKPKLAMMKLNGECEVESNCACLKLKQDRKMMIKLRGGTAAFQIEMGRWHAWGEGRGSDL